MRDKDVGRRIIEVVVMGFMLGGRVAQELLEAAPANGDVDPEDAPAIKMRLGVPARVIVGHDGGERKSLIFGPISFGVVVAERVAPSSFGREILLARGEGNDA